MRSFGGDAAKRNQERFSWNVLAGNAFNSLNLLVVSYGRLQRLPGSRARSDSAPPLAPAFRKAPQEFCRLSGRIGAK